MNAPMKLTPAQQIRHLKDELRAARHRQEQDAKGWNQMLKRSQDDRDELVAALKEAKDVLEHLPLTGDIVHAICMADGALAKVAV